MCVCFVYLCVCVSVSVYVCECERVCECMSVFVYCATYEQKAEEERVAAHVTAGDAAVKEVLSFCLGLYDTNMYTHLVFFGHIYEMSCCWRRCCQTGCMCFCVCV